MKRVIYLVFLWIVAVPGAASSLVETIQERGYLRCGVSENVPGLSSLDPEGNWQGFWTAYCRALATAVLGDMAALEFVPVIPANRFQLLQEGEVDVLMANTTWTLNREATLGVQFTATLLYDGQRILAHGELPIQQLAEAQGERICVVDDTTTKAQLEAFNARHDDALEIVSLNTYEGAWRAFIAKECDLISNDYMALMLHLHQRVAAPENYRVLPETLSKEPLSPAVRKGDDVWFDVVRWVGFATITAEELGLNRDNITAQRDTSQDASVRRLLGLEGELGQAFGLDADWAYRVIRDVGNYGEIFAQTIGDESPFRLERGPNRLPRDGGMLYAPPFR